MDLIERSSHFRPEAFVSEQKEVRENTNVIFTAAWFVLLIQDDRFSCVHCPFFSAIDGDKVSQNGCFSRRKRQFEWEFSVGDAVFQISQRAFDPLQWFALKLEANKYNPKPVSKWKHDVYSIFQNQRETGVVRQPVEKYVFFQFLAILLLKGRADNSFIR